MKQLLPLFLFALLLSLRSEAQVAPFIATTWNQTCFYNDSCPTVSSGGSCGRAYTGCNATALAMICKYYSWPSNGMSSHCNSNLPSQCVNFTTQTYNYAAMPNNVTSANGEVSKLMWHLGAACDMMYSGTSSNSFFDAAVLKRYFVYSPRMYSTASFMFPTTQELIDAIKAELNAGRPVYAKGGNHFYLIDGYDASDNFHCNFGWSGTYNNYYPITAVINPAGNFTPVNFMFMIRPLAGDLELSGDTIVIGASGGSAFSFEFTSLLNWTLSTPDSWLSTALTSGTPGYYAYSDGNTFSATVNNGVIRYGYIYVQNANDFDTIVVQQDASLLGVNPDTLFYTAAGSTQNAALACQSWMNWTATSPDSWIGISPASGTGNASPGISAAPNASASPRLGYIVITSGVFRDTVWILQEGSTLGVPATATITYSVFPVPASENITIQGLNPDHTYRITFFSASGQIAGISWLRDEQNQVNISQLSPGMYIMRIEGNCSGDISETQIIVQ